MAVETVLDWITTIIIDGQPVETALAVYNDIGEIVAYGTTETGLLSNGVGVQCTSLATGASASTTTGMGLLATEVGAAGAAIAPALGVLAGLGLYNLAPDFWADVNERLRAAGKTIGNKIIGYVNGDGKTYFDVDTIDIFKDAFIEAGLFDGEVEYPEHSSVTEPIIATTGVSAMSAIQGMFDYYRDNNIRELRFSTDSIRQQLESFVSNYNDHILFAYCQVPSQSISTDAWNINMSFVPKNSVAYLDGNVYSFPTSASLSLHMVAESFKTFATINNIITRENPSYISSIWKGLNLWDTSNYYHYDLSTQDATKDTPYAQPEAIYPSTTKTIPETYPLWIPETPSTLPNMYPVEIPLPDTLQDPAQNPDPTQYPDDYNRWLIDNLPIPAPSPDSPIVPPIDPDPSPILTPPANPTIVTVEDNPIDPNMPPIPDPTAVVPVLPTTVQSTALFTVYNPSISALDDLGGYLWSQNIIDIVSKIWQNPLDAIISLKQIYSAPAVGSSKNIKLGYLDTGVQAPVVTSQFKRFSCGSVTISEKNRNVTDYSPYASVHIYLPFVGIVPLDVDEVMDSSIRVEYCVDVYTGTCLAEIYVTRSPDMTVEKILYTFSGNCAQDIPLTAATANGLMSSLASIGAAAIGVVAGGGALGAVAGAHMMGHSLTHEMLHIGHSGSLSSNAGIMGEKKPYVIIGRRHGYDANAYNEIYGYPVNKTVYLGNCVGFTRVKAINLQSSATSAERDEITALLSNGVLM